jgi:hypothetical protein
VDRVILVKLDKGVILSSDVILSEPFMAAMAKFLRAISDFVDGRRHRGLRPSSGDAGQHGSQSPG